MAARGPRTTAEPARLLRLKLIWGRNLAKKDIFGASDPYVIINLVSVFFLKNFPHQNGVLLI
jgi:hypothetical protein